MPACRPPPPVEHLVRLRGDKVRDAQVAFLAIDARGQVGAHAIQPGFTYAVTDATGTTRVLPAGSLRPGASR